MSKCLSEEQGRQDGHNPSRLRFGHPYTLTCETWLVGSIAAGEMIGL